MDVDEFLWRTGRSSDFHHFQFCTVGIQVI